MRVIEAVAERPPALDAGEPGIVRRFLAWAQRADAEGRAEAASALARAYLYSDLGAQARAEAALGLTAVLDDPSALVRRALAEAFASAAEAPRHIVLALACDQSEVASVVLARSPALTDAELVDCAAVGDVAAQTALARRPRLSPGVAAALAEIGRREAVLALADNLEADLPASALWRIFERFGEDAEAREALLSRAWLPPALRNELAAATARALADFAARCDWLSPERAAAHRARGARTGDRRDCALQRGRGARRTRAAHARRGDADRGRADARLAQRRSRLLRPGAGGDFRRSRAARRRLRAQPGEPRLRRALSQGALAGGVPARLPRRLGRPGGAKARPRRQDFARPGRAGDRSLRARADPALRRSSRCCGAWPPKRRAKMRANSPTTRRATARRDGSPPGSSRRTTRLC